MLLAQWPWGNYSVCWISHGTSYKNVKSYHHLWNGMACMDTVINRQKMSWSSNAPKQNREYMSCSSLTSELTGTIHNILSLSQLTDCMSSFMFWVYLLGFVLPLASTWAIYQLCTEYLVNMNHSLLFSGNGEVCLVSTILDDLLYQDGSLNIS